MAATDYEFATGLANAYLTRKKKKPKNGTMSVDRRIVEDGEIIGLFEFYLRQWCEEHKQDTVVIKSGGKKIFEATLLDPPHRRMTTVYVESRYRVVAASFMVHGTWSFQLQHTVSNGVFGAGADAGGSPRSPLRYHVQRKAV